MAQAGVNPHTAADLLRQAMAQKYVSLTSVALSFVPIENLSTPEGHCIVVSLNFEP